MLKEPVNKNKLIIPLYNIIKLKSKDIVNNRVNEIIKIKEKKRKQITYRVPAFDITEAITNKMVISVADHFVFREIRKLKGDYTTQQERLNRIEIIREEIISLKRKELNPNNSEINKQNHKKMMQEFDELLFVPEVIAVENTKKDYSQFSKKGFFFGEKYFTRHCASSNNLKCETVLFVEDTINRIITNNLTCGHKAIDSTDEVIPSKYGAYAGLATTGCAFITTPNVIVVPDLNYTKPSGYVNYIHQELDKTDNKTVHYHIEKKMYDNGLNSFDGMGLCSPKWAEKTAEELGLDYIPAAFNMRSVGIKGLVVTFDFHKFAEDSGEFIKNIKGDLVSIKDADLILTESQWKLHRLFDSDFDLYARKHKENDLVWGVQRVTPKHNVERSKLSYQLIQTSNLQDEDIEELLQPTKDYFRRLAESDNLVTMYALLQDYIMSCEQDEYKGTITNSAILKNMNLINDAYIKGQIEDAIQGAIKEAKIGRIFCRSNFQVMISDPFALCQWIMLRDEFKVTGLITANKVYSKFWTDRGVSKLDCCRFPMTDIAEHNVVDVISDGTMQEWYKYINSGIVYSIHDLSVIVHSDSDWDSDQVLSTPSDILIRCKYNDFPVTYDKEGTAVMKKEKYNIKTATKSDLQGFGNRVGQFSNKTTNFFAMLPMFDGEEKQKIFDNIKILRLIIGQEIDSTKTGIKPDLPSEFVWKRINYNDDAENRERKEVNNRFVPDIKPYFFRYLYDTDDKLFKKYESKMKIACQKLAFMTLNKLLALSDEQLNDKQKEFKKLYYNNSPLLHTPCIMNKLCWNMEKFDREELKSKFKLKNENFVLLSFAENIELNIAEKHIIRQIFDQYTKDMSSYTKKINTAVKSNNNDKKTEMLIEKNKLKYTARNQLYDICSNSKQLFNMVVKALENLDKSKINKFIWNVFNEDILDVIPEGSTRIKITKCVFGNGTHDLLYTGLNVEVVDSNVLAG